MEKSNIQQASDIHTYIFPHSHSSGGKKWTKKKIAKRARYISFIILRVFYFLYFFCCCCCCFLSVRVWVGKKWAHTAIIQNNSMNIKITTYTSIYWSNAEENDLWIYVFLFRPLAHVTRQLVVWVLFVCVREWKCFIYENHIPPLFLLVHCSVSVIYVVRGRVKEGRKGCAFHVCEYITNTRSYTHTHPAPVPLALCNKHMRTCHTTRSLLPRTNKNFSSFSASQLLIIRVYTHTRSTRKIGKFFFCLCVCVRKIDEFSLFLSEKDM